MTPPEWRAQRGDLAFPELEQLRRGEAKPPTSLVLDVRRKELTPELEALHRGPDKPPTSLVLAVRREELTPELAALHRGDDKPPTSLVLAVRREELTPELAALHRGDEKPPEPLELAARREELTPELEALHRGDEKPTVPLELAVPREAMTPELQVLHRGADKPSPPPELLAERDKLAFPQLEALQRGDETPVAPPKLLAEPAKLAFPQLDALHRGDENPPPPPELPALRKDRPVPQLDALHRGDENPPPAPELPARREELAFPELEALRRGVKPKRIGRLQRWFPPRHFMVRGRDRTRVLYLGPRLQMAAATFCVAGLLGVGVTAFAAAWTHRLAEQLAREIELVSSTARIEAERAAEDRELLSRLGRELSRSFAERDRFAAAAFADGRTLAEQRVAIARLIDERKADMDHVTAEREAAIARTISERNAVVANVLAGREAAMENEIAQRFYIATERDKALAERDEAIAERDRALIERDKSVTANRQMLLQLDAQTRSTIAQVEGIIASTGVDLARVRKPTAQEPSRGGPFVAWNGKDKDHKDHAPIDIGSAEVKQIQGVAGGLGRLQSLRDLLERMPLAGPVAQVEIANEFGFRMDPFTGLPARHEGVDLRGARNASIYATAAGTVAFAGWQSEYGNLVEINHGFGLTTRYAHLSKILVKVGDTVGLRQQLGLIGATGRGTGVHLHYEVRVDGRARNPVNFLKAVRYVPEKVPTASDQFSGFHAR